MWSWVSFFVGAVMGIGFFVLFVIVVAGDEDFGD